MSDGFTEEEEKGAEGEEEEEVGEEEEEEGEEEEEEEEEEDGEVVGECPLFVLCCCRNPSPTRCITVTQSEHGDT